MCGLFLLAMIGATQRMCGLFLLAMVKLTQCVRGISTGSG